MKNLLLITSILVITTWVARGQESETRNIGSFSGVKVTEGIDVYLKRGDKESVRVEVTGTSLRQCYYGGFRFLFTRSYARW